MEDFLKLTPRPKRLPHNIPGPGFIADRFKDVFAWPQTVRKFPIKDPNIGPEAVGYCAESLAKTKSLEWLFHEVFLRESAFRAPVVSEYPTHAAVGIVRDEESGYLFSVTVYVQVNSTRVRKEMEAEWEETKRNESLAGDGPLRAELLRRLGRMADPRALPLFKRRCGSSDPEVRAAALDALFLNDCEAAEKQVERWSRVLGRAREDGDHAKANGIAASFAAVRYDASIRSEGESLIAGEERLAEAALEFVDGRVRAGDLKDARATLSHLADRVRGLPIEERVRKKLAEITPDEGD
jgi:hypothetical protein